jgi:hypothetical protein
MTLTVADIERWDAGDVREVFHAATSRAQAAFDASDGLAELPALATWGGMAAKAAKEAIGKTRKDFDAHGNEVMSVANAARSAADNIERIKTELATLKADAESLEMEVDSVSGQVVAGPNFRGNPMELLLKTQQLQPRLDRIVAEANSVDMALANAIHMADGTTPIPPPDNRVLDRPLPEDPDDFDQLWKSLSKEQRDYLYSRDHNVGNHDGMPVGDGLYPGRDYYNRLNLADQLSQATSAGIQADALKAQHPDWAGGENIPEPNKPGAIFDDRLQYEAWQRQYTDALNRSKYLPDLQAVNNAVKDNPDRKLMLLDTQSGRQVRAAVAIGDPDTATHVSVTTPGLNTTVRGAIESMTSEATNLQRGALSQLSLSPGHENDTVSTIAWIGYDPPQVPGTDDIGASLAGGYEVSHDDVAKAGAVDLSRFYEGVQASHESGPAHLTAIGHSYGSLTTGLALQEPGEHGVTDAIFYGSPGIEATVPQDLQLQPGHVFTMETPDDPIQWVYDGPPIAHAAAPLLPGIGPLATAGLFAADVTGAGDFGPNPATNPNFVHMATGAVSLPDGHGGMLNLDAAHGHSDYPRQGTTTGPDGMLLPRTTGYNIAAVIAGLDNNVIRQK